MSAKKKGKKEWDACGNEDFKSSVGAAIPEVLHRQQRLETYQHLDGTSRKTSSGYRAH